MIKKLASHIKEYKKPSILCPIMVALESVFEVLIPFVMATIIDEGLNKGNMSYVIQYGVVMLALAICSLIVGVLAGKYAATASTGFAKNLRKDMFYHIQEFSFENIDKYSNAGLVTRLTTDITNVQNAFMMVIRLLIKAPVMLIFAMAVCFGINVQMALIFVVAIIVLGCILTLIIYKATSKFESIFPKYDNLNSIVQENVSAIRTVKSYVREDYEIEKFKKRSFDVKKHFKDAEKIIVYNMPAMQFTIYACMIAISWFGAKCIVASTLTTGELMSLFTYAMLILVSLMLISMVFVMIIMARASIKRIVEVLDEEVTLKNGENPIVNIENGSIEFENVDFSYNKDSENYNLENINLSIESGQTVGVIGGTGSAKSTLVSLIPRLYDTLSGSVKVAGKDVREYDLKALRDNVAMVLQNNVLFSGTIKENLRWGNKDATDEELIQACKNAQAHEFIMSLPDKYDTYIEQGGTNVSGGQKQRLCIARALLKNPKILILDDSTSAVDTKTDALIQRSFLNNIPDVTKIIIAQRISSVENADKTIVLDDGKVDGIGSHEELIKNNEIYKQVYESQVKGVGMNA